jgi:hypothetical protein
MNQDRLRRRAVDSQWNRRGPAALGNVFGVHAMQFMSGSAHAMVPLMAQRDTAQVPGARMWAAATWLLVLPFYTAGVAKYSARIELAGMTVLVFACSVRRPVRRSAVARIYAVCAVFALVVIADLPFRPWPSQFGTAASYDKQAVLFIATYTAVAAFGAVFFIKRIFADVVWWASTIALWIGVAACVASLVTGSWSTRPTEACG